MRLAISIEASLPPTRRIRQTIRGPLRCLCRAITIHSFLCTNCADCHVMARHTIRPSIIILWWKLLLLLLTTSSPWPFIILMVCLNYTAVCCLLVLVTLYILSIIRHVQNTQLRIILWWWQSSDSVMWHALHVAVAQGNINRPKPYRRRLIQISVLSTAATTINRWDLREIWMIQILPFSRLLSWSLHTLVLLGCRGYLVLDAALEVWGTYTTHLILLLLVRSTMSLHLALFLYVHFFGLLFHKVGIRKVLVLHLKGPIRYLLRLILRSLQLFSFPTLLGLCLILLSKLLLMHLKLLPIMIFHLNSKTKSPLPNPQ